MVQSGKLYMKSHDITFAVIVTIIVVALAFLVASAVGCTSSDQRGIEVEPAHYQAEVEALLANAHDTLKDAGARVSMPRHLRVYVVHPTTRTAKGDYGISFRGVPVAGLTHGIVVQLVSRPDGTSQPHLWMMELGHSVLVGNDEASDYNWFRKVGWMTW